MKNIQKSLIFVFLTLFIYIALSSLANAQIVDNFYLENVVEGTNSATLYGKINPNGFMTTAWFEYGIDPNLSNYDETTHVFVGSQNSYVNLQATIKNLKPNTIYYVRIVSDNTRTTSKSGITDFATYPLITNTVTNANQVTTNTDTKIINTNVKNTTSKNVIYKTVVLDNSNVIPVQNSNYNNYNTQNKSTTTGTIYIDTGNKNQNTYSYSSNQTANTILGVRFLPNNIFSYLLIILLIILIIAVIRRIMEI